MAHLGPWFAFLTLLVSCGETAACLLVAAVPRRPAAWAALAAVALALGGIATLLLDRLVLDAEQRLARDSASVRQTLEAALTSKTEQQRRLRHDMRGALSPVLLVADRLVNHADPAVKRSGEIMVRTVDRATALLAEATERAASPPDGP